MTFTIVQIVTLDSTGDTMHRMKWPAEALAGLDPTLRVLNVNAYIKERYELGRNADLLVLFQSNDAGFLDVIAERKRKGLKTLVEYNDNFYSPQPWSPIAKEWESASLHSTYESFMREADGVIVTGPGLLELFQKRVRTPIHILENDIYVQPDSIEVLLRKKTSYPSFGWAGSLGHIADLLAAKPLIQSVLATVPGSVFHVMGNEAIPDVLAIPKEKIRYSPWAGMQEYFSFWEPVWVGIAPLLVTDYNRCRSDIKIVEMGACGVAPVVSPLLPYEELIDRCSIPTAQRFDDYAAKVCELLRSSQKRISTIEKLHSYISDRRFGPKRADRLHLYRSLLPQSASQYQWPASAGYSEINGEKDTVASIDPALSEAQAKLAAKDAAGAKVILANAHARAPYNPDIHLSLCKVLLHMRDDTFDGEIKRCIAAFPHDIRGILLWLKKPMQPDALVSTWREVISSLRNHSEAVKRGWAKELCGLMGSQLPSVPHLVETAEELLLTYPYKHSLRVVVAQLRDQMGHYNEALAHFEVLSRTRKNFDAGDDEIAAFERGYVEAMRAALEARKKGAFI